MDMTPEQNAMYEIDKKLDAILELHKGMEVKMFEVRDRGTILPVLAIRLSAANDFEEFLLSRAGYGANNNSFKGYVILISIDGTDMRAKHNAFDWDNRTLRTAHSHIHDYYDELKSGSVIDVEYLLEETETAKKSEREI